MAFHADTGFLASRQAEKASKLSKLSVISLLSSLLQFFGPNLSAAANESVTLAYKHFCSKYSNESVKIAALQLAAAACNAGINASSQTEAIKV